MWRDGDDRNFFFVRPIEPENSIGGWGFILGVSLKDFLSIWPRESAIFMGVQTWMPWIGFKVAEGLSNGLEALEEAGISSKRFEVRFGLWREFQVEGHASVNVVVRILCKAS